MMFCCYTKRKQKQARELSLHKKRKKIDPIEIYNECQTQQEFTSLFLSEVITCGPCGKAFTLRQDQVIAYCGSCFQFLHCNIAGKCVGPNCSYTIKGQEYKQTFCISCVPKTIIINLEKNGPSGSCLCQECLDDPRTKKCYKRVL